MGRAGAGAQTVAGIRNAVASSVFTIINTTIIWLNTKGLPHTLKFIKSLGFKATSRPGPICSGRDAECRIEFSESNLVPVMVKVRDAVRRLGLKLIWYTTTQYCQLDPINMELWAKACTAAKYNMFIEPDGSAIPCQS